MNPRPLMCAALLAVSGCAGLDRALAERDAARAELASQRTEIEKAKAELEKTRRGWTLVPVAVASVDLPAGAVVTPDNISQRSVPAQFVTSSVVKPDAASYLVNQKVLVPVQAGDWFLWSQFDVMSSAERLSTVVGKEQRLVNVPVVRDEGVGGFVRPNDHVDVIAVLKDAKSGLPYAQTVLENVVVAATGKITARTNVNLLPEKERLYGDVTLLVTSKEAEKLALAKYVATLSLAIRGEGDRAIAPPNQKTTLDELERKIR
jgi:pilus assembly protein CpaB